MGELTTDPHAVPPSSALKHAEALARLAYWEFHCDSRQGLASAGLLSRLGDPLTESGFSLDKLELRIHPQDIAAWQEWVGGLIRGELAPARAVHTAPAIRLCQLLGGWVWFRLKADLVVDPQSDNAGQGGRRLFVLFEDCAEQKALEAALRDSQMRYRSLYDLAPVAVIMTERTGIVTEWNLQASAIFGWSRHEVLGRSLMELLLPAEQRPAFAGRLMEALKREGRTPCLVQECQTESASLATCQWQSARLSSDSGAVYGLLTLIQDVTESHRSTLAVQRNELLYRTLVETSPDAILLIETDGRIQIANQQAVRLFAADTVFELYEQTADGLFSDPVWKDFVATTLREAENLAGFVDARELSVTRSDGQSLVLQIFFTGLGGTGPDSDGAGTVLFLRDISQARRAEGELLTYRSYLENLVHERTQTLELKNTQLEVEIRERQRAEQRQIATGRVLAQIIDGSPVPTFVIDAEHTVTHWNRASELILGISAADMVGTRDAWKAFYPAERPVMADLMVNFDHAGLEDRYGDRFRASPVVLGAYEADGYFPKIGRWLSFVASRLTDADGATIGAIETLQDITERKRAETALLEAKNSAESAAQAKGSFLANMSHEIRTPMNAVLGLARLLMKTAADDQQRDYIKRIIDAGGMLLGLLNDVLDLSKIEAGRMTVERVAFCLDEVLENANSMVLHRVREKGLELNLSVAPGVPSDLIGDPLRLSQILVNLLSNAVKFTERGFIAVFVRCERKSTENLTLFVDVQDTGIGLSPEQAGRLFAAFTQADDSTTRRYGGTGLGLAISKRLAEAMDGTLSLTSEAGQGSTFSFSVNLGFVDGPPASAASSLPADLLGARALVVDDQRIACTVLCALLADLGLTTEMALGGEQALAMLSQADPPYRLLFADWLMPGMDGVALLQNIRRDLPIDRQPISILVSAADRQEIMAATQHTRFDGMVHKPASKARVLRLLAGLYGSLPAHEPGGVQPIFAGGRVILADDVENNQLIAAESLGELGLQVDIASNGQQVLDLLATGKAYVAVLMDVQMPVMDGLEATRRLRADPHFARLPVIALTAHAGSEEQDRCQTAGMNDFLTKPFTPQALSRILVRWLPAAQRAASAAAVEVPPPVVATKAPSMPDLPGIDASIGLPYMNNKVAFYEKMLKAFPARFARNVESARVALAASDCELAERSVHTLKGAAGSIGAVRLQRAATLVDQALRGERAICELEIAELDAALQEVVDGIRNCYGE
jgi:PAS domain S-box-containing protein